MSDIPNISEKELSGMAQQAFAASGFGDMAGNRAQIFQDPKLPITVYDINPNAQLEQKALEPNFLFPADLVDCIIHRANNCGVGPMTLLRQHVAYALLRGELNGKPLDFPALLPKEPKLAAIKRKQADDAKEPSNIDKFIQLLLKDQSTWYQLTALAKAAGITNQAALVILVDAIVDGDVLKELIADSKAAMVEYEKLRKKKHLLQDALGHIG